jgi:hypothetical protein
MALLQIILDDPESIQRQIKQLRDLIIDYNSKIDPFTKTWLPILVSLGVVMVTIGGQWFIFRLNKNKEIKLRVAELYGKFQSKSIHYKFTMWQYNSIQIIVKRDNFLVNYYSKKCNDEFYSPDDDEIEKHNRFHKLHTESKAKLISDWQKYKDAKIELIEILYQIHFYYNNTNFYNLIRKVRTKDCISIEITEYNSDLEKGNFIDILFKEKLQKEDEEFSIIFKDISDSLLTLSK